jgi:hypothetical protein
MVQYQTDERCCPRRDYLLSVIDGKLDRLLTGLAAVAVEGPKGVGKTESARRRAHEVLRTDRAADRDLLRAQA